MHNACVSERQWLLANHSRADTHFWMFSRGIRLRVRFAVNVRARVSVKVSGSVSRSRLKVLTTRLTLGVLHAFVRKWLTNS